MITAATAVFREALPDGGRLAGLDDPRTTIFHTSLSASVVLTATTPFIWTWPTPEGWGALVLLGVLGGLGHGLLVMAFATPAVLCGMTLNSYLAALGRANVVMWITLAALPLVLLLRKASAPQGGPAAHAIAD